MKTSTSFNADLKKKKINHIFVYFCIAIKRLLALASVCSHLVQDLIVLHDL